MKTTFLLVIVTTLASCSTTKSSNVSVKSAKLLSFIGSVPVAGKTLAGQEILLGGFSGLMLDEDIKSASSTELHFRTITDRGPNGFQVEKDRPFLLPEFSPQIVQLKVDTEKLTYEIESTLPLKKKNGKPITGLPNVRTEENPVDSFGFIYSLDSEGLDTESLVSDGEGGFWVGEEYAPSLVHFNNQGVMLRRLMPFNELPKMYAERKTNRGFEGIAKDGNKLFGFLQSPLPSDGQFARIVEVDLETMKTSGEYFYDFNKGLDKIGDAISLGHDQFLVVEQNGKKGPDSKKYIYKITLNGTDNHVKKELILDLGQTPFKDIEKVEGITVIDQKHIVLVNDNDFQISDKTNYTTGMTPLNHDQNEMMLVEFDQNIY